MKNLRYYTQHSQYVEPIDKPAVSYCEQEDEIHYSPVPVTITFTIDGTSYQAEEGMIWTQWVNSNYNTGGFYIGTYGSTNNAILNSMGSAVSNNNIVTENDSIISNFSYDVYLPAE